MAGILEQYQEARKKQETNYSNPNYVFGESREYIEASMGIELTLIELIRLKELSVESVNRNSKVQGRYSKANPVNDAIEIFLHDYYGVPLSMEKTTGEPNEWACGRFEFIEENDYDAYREFWKKRQEEAHLP